MLQASGKKALDREGQEAASPMDAIKLTRPLFERLISAPPLKRLMEGSTPFGLKDRADVDLRDRRRAVPPDDRHGDQASATGPEARF